MMPVAHDVDVRELYELGKQLAVVQGVLVPPPPPPLVLALVITVTGVLAGLVPTTLVAVTVMLYDVPAVNPEMVYEVTAPKLALEEAVLPEASQVTV